jgi:hypothetical protein
MPRMRRRLRHVVPVVTARIQKITLKIWFFSIKPLDLVLAGIAHDPAVKQVQRISDLNLAVVAVPGHAAGEPRAGGRVNLGNFVFAQVMRQLDEGSFSKCFSTLIMIAALNVGTLLILHHN